MTHILESNRTSRLGPKDKVGPGYRGLTPLRFHSAESFPKADGGTVSDDPEVWLAAVASTLKKPA